ncbi:MAG: hypothetical protein HY318_02745 [Armatimonadetes bacterium]|nr:hypothetical protein [Armatimonadota bacterium]
MRKQLYAESGFTLVEATVASLIAALVLSGVYGAFNSAQRAVSQAETASDLNQLGRAVLSDLMHELNNCYPLFEEEELSGENSIVFHALDAIDSKTKLDNDSLDFVTVSGRERADGKPGSDLIRLRYEISDISLASERRRRTSTPTGLVRYTDYYPNLGAQSSGKQSAEPRFTDPAHLQTVEEVRSLNLRYWDAKAGDWADHWEDNKALPSAIEVTLGFVRDADLPAGGEKREHMIYVSGAADLPMYRLPVQQSNGKANGKAEPAGGEVSPGPP